MTQGSELIQGKATICIPNYKTLDFTRLCLRSIRRFTNYPCDVIVVDNDSRDESLDYLKSVPWIRLVERRVTGGELKGSTAEGSALNIGLKNCSTEFYVVMHTDTIVRRENWLTDLIKYFDDDKEVTCVGCDKIDARPKWRTMLRKAGDFKTIKRKITGDTSLQGRFRYHNCTICCLYRTSILKQEKLSFMPDLERGITSGKGLYFDLVDRGYKTVELPPDIMNKYIVHLDHATQIINPDEFEINKRTVKRCSKHFQKVMTSDSVIDILLDNSLDS